MARTISDQQILEAAVEVIVRRGYAGATTREISAVAGMNEVTLFRRFGNKEQLLRAVVEQEAEHLVAAGVAYTGDLLADLSHIVHFYQRLMLARGHVIATLINEIPRQPELMEIMATPLSIFARITSTLERYQHQGLLIEEPPTQAFLALVGPIFLEGILGYIQPQVVENSLDPDELVQRYLQGRAGRSFGK